MGPPRIWWLRDAPAFSHVALAVSKHFLFEILDADFKETALYAFVGNSITYACQFVDLLSAGPPPPVLAR
jgi:hypothetical protein